MLSVFVLHTSISITLLLESTVYFIYVPLIPSLVLLKSLGLTIEPNKIFLPVVEYKKTSFLPIILKSDVTLDIFRIPSL